jgi:transcriptional regulator with XRE-family HTH domain
MDIIDQIAARMRDRQWTQADLARAAGIPRPSISSLLSRSIEPRKTTLERIATALGAKLALMPDD